MVADTLVPVYLRGAWGCLGEIESVSCYAVFVVAALDRNRSLNLPFLTLPPFHPHTLTPSPPSQVNGQPGGQWQVVTLEDGQVYYYHEITRQTTWSVQDTFS